MQSNGTNSSSNVILNSSHSLFHRKMTIQITLHVLGVGFLAAWPNDQQFSPSQSYQ